MIRIEPYGGTGRVGQPSSLAQQPNLGIGLHCLDLGKDSAYWIGEPSG